MKTILINNSLLDNFPDEQKRILKDILTIAKNENKNNQVYFLDRKYKSFNILNIIAIDSLTHNKKYLVMDNRKNCIRFSFNRHNWIDMNDIEEFRKYLYK